MKTNKKKKELSRLRHGKNELKLDEDDLILIEENQKNAIGLGGRGLEDLDDEDDVIAPIKVARKPIAIPKSLQDDEDEDEDDGDFDKEDEDEDELDEDGEEGQL